MIRIAPMGILDVFSKRNKQTPDVYVYDTLPDKLRRQIVHIVQDALGPDLGMVTQSASWSSIANAIAREHGLLKLSENVAIPIRSGDHCADCMNYILFAEAELALDMVQHCFQIIDGPIRGDLYHQRMHSSASPDEAIAELNHRFRENASGYQYESGVLVRIDSQFTHSEIVRPALALLRTKGFEAANKEFLSAHEHFRHQRIEESITDACKAFESTMKVICEARKFKYDKNKATAAPLIGLLVKEGLVPSYSEEQLGALAKCLLGPATVRNKNSGHGAGTQPRQVAGYFAAYALHLTASNILFLVQCHLTSAKR